MGWARSKNTVFVFPAKAFAAACAAALMRASESTRRRSYQLDCLQVLHTAERTFALSLGLSCCSYWVRQIICRQCLQSSTPHHFRQTGFARLHETVKRSVVQMSSFAVGMHRSRTQNWTQSEALCVVVALQRCVERIIGEVSVYVCVNCT